MKTYDVRFEIEVPDDVPEADLEKFLKFELGEVCSLSGDNALASYDLESLTVRYVTVR